MTKSKIAIVRGKFLNAYEMQLFEPLIKKYDITAFGSMYPYHKNFAFPTKHLFSPMDLPEFPYKMPILNRVFTDAHYLFGLEESLKGYDLVHTAETYYHYTQQALLAKKKKYIKKVVATVLENIPFNNEGIYGRKTFKINARNHLDHIIALTQRTKETLLLEGADEEKITVISHGIDTHRFVPASKHFIEIGKRKQKLTILFTGRLEIYKGVYEILYAAKLLQQDKELKKYTLQFIFAGEGSEKQKMKNLIEKLNLKRNCMFMTSIYGRMHEIYALGDIFVAPSKASPYWQEQYNTALLEAQASALPIVTTLSGGIPENVADAALLIGSGDFHALYDALKKFILNPKLRVTYAKKARERAEKVHDIRVIASKIDTVYKHVLSI